MADLTNRLPGRMILVFVAKPLTTVALCEHCQQEAALAQWTAFLPPDTGGAATDAHALDARLEAWLLEQGQGRLRFVEVTPIGAACLAQYAAQHMQDAAMTPHFASYFMTQPFPDQLVGALSVEPGLAGLTYPMVLAMVGTFALNALVVQLNAPTGTLDATEAVFTQEREHGTSSGGADS
ncbi:MAG: hypothetical protein H0X24_00900 [Ktedonobacterales bacterium]|nr:hypothetical protein [Ktedonobacterales bacterium]